MKHDKSPNYTLELDIAEQRVVLRLHKASAVVAERAWQENRDLAERFFGELEALLTEAGVPQQQISTMRYRTDLGPEYTTERIAQVLTDTFNATV